MTTILIYNLAGVLVSKTKLKADQQPVKLFVGRGIYLVKDSETGEVMKVKL